MAIRSISRLQHRRGLKSDLPLKLHEGEIGWCLDTRELFIGNSDGYGGNSQILTQWTPNDLIIRHAYQSANGVESMSMPRSIGSILNDRVNVRDYGAVGNGIVDDYQAIQNTITDLYGTSAVSGYSETGGYVTIWIPAGTYKITKPLKLYPFVRLQGDGADRTRIVLVSEDSTCVVQTVDGDGNTDANIGMDGAVLPSGIEIVDLWLEQPREDADVIRLQRSSNLKLKGLRISGPRINGNNTQLSGCGIKIESLGTVPAHIPTNIIVNECEIIGMDYAIYSDDPISDLRVNLCDIHDCWNGIVLGFNATLGGPAKTKVTNNIFEDLDGYGIAYYGSNLGVISSGNSFDTVGNYYLVNPIYWDSLSTGCASIADQFTGTLPTVKNINNLNTAQNIIVGPQQVSVSSYTPIMIGPVVLADNRPINAVDMTIQYTTTEFNNIVIDYTLTRGANKRLGKLTILTDGSNAIISDEFTTLGNDLGVTFGYRISAGKLILTYITTNIGVNATMVYSENKWLA